MSASYKLGCRLSYELDDATPFIFNFEVARLFRHKDLVETLAFSPDVETGTYEVPDARNRYRKVVAPKGIFELEYKAEVTLDEYRADPASVREIPVAELPLDIMPFLLPSRFVPSDRLAPFARREFGKLPKGHCRVTSICNWLYENLDYERGSTDEETTAAEALLQRAGVCRDFAHLGIAFCRSLQIPARFVSCYAYGLEPSDFHAVFEAFLEGRWWLFDGTRQANLDGLIRIGIGRDAAEIAFASPFCPMKAAPPQIFIEHLDSLSEKPGRTVDAISTEEPAPNAGAL